MENVLVAVVIIFILLFGGLTFSESLLSAQETMMKASQTLENRADDIRNTSVSPSDLRIVDAGGTIDVLVKNTGSAKLVDFNLWDVFVDYFDNAVTPVYHTDRLVYDASMTTNNSWSAGSIYYDGKQNIAETYDHGILNPGEEIILHLKLMPAVGVGQSAQVTVATANGVIMSTVGMRNAVPTLPVNTGFRVANHGITLISPDVLLADDTDNTSDELTFTMTTPPAQGVFAPATGFTQADIDDGNVTYTHTGAGVDTFAFTASDGIDEIGPFTANVTINAMPFKAVSAGLTLLTGTTATITNGLLQMTDADDTPDKLIYTITRFPSNGALSLGSTFTQADVDGNRLTYTSINTSSDEFDYIVSDGFDVIGTYTFLIQVDVPETTPEP